MYEAAGVYIPNLIDLNDKQCLAKTNWVNLNVFGQGVAYQSDADRLQSLNNPSDLSR